MAWQQKKRQFRSELDSYDRKIQTPQIPIEDLQPLKAQYEQLSRNISSYLKEQASNYNLSAQLQETGTLQQQLIALEKERDALETDVDTALARDEVLRKRKETGNRHTLYLLDRPVRRGMVPYLWALSVLFVGVGVLFFYWLTPALLLPAGGLAADALDTSSSVLSMLSDIFSHRYTWMALFGAASVVILSLSLKIAGVFGK